MSLTISRLKQPRTFHLPWSEGATSDDKFIESLVGFKDHTIQITLKMDGETTSAYSDGFTHARALDSGIKDEGQAWFKQYWLNKLYSTQHFNDWLHIKGESLYWEHSLQYTEAVHAFQVFAVWCENQKNRFVLKSTDFIEDTIAELGLHSVPVVYNGKFDQRMLEKFHETLDLSKVEGYVVRVCNDITLENFSRQVAKFVRKGHVQTDQHWRRQLKRNPIPKHCFE
jgi:hypothetical protein